MWQRIAGAQARRPLVWILCGVALAALAVVSARRLELKPQLSELLPQDSPSVVELRHVLERTRGLSNVFVLLEGEDRTQLRAFGDALVPRLLALGSPWVGSAETGVQEARAFLAPRAGLFAPKEKLEELRDELDQARRSAFSSAIGADFDDEPAPAETAPKITAERLQSMLGGQAQQASRYPDGYYESPDGKALVVVARSNVLADDVERARSAVSRIEAVVNDVHATPAYKTVRVSYAGDLVTGLAEYSAVRSDLMHVGVLGVSLVLGIVLLFYFRIRVLLLMGATIAIGVAFTFGVTQVFIGTLNTATGFLFSIVAGNGINSGIILQSRYLEERGRGLSVERALEAALTATWKPTLSAAAAAAAAYAALAATAFRGFQHFAFIGAAGMLLCWLATYAVLPALIVLGERLVPINPNGPLERFIAPVRARVSRFDAPFTAAVRHAPRAVVLLGVFVSGVGALALVAYIKKDPLEYNLRHMENDKTLTRELYRASARAASIVGANVESAMIVLANSTDQVRPLQAALRARRDAAPPDLKPFEEVHGLPDFVADDQKAKIPLLLEIRRKLERAHDLGGIEDAEWTRLAPYLPPPDLRPYTANDLPAAVRLPFTERDGSVGKLLYIEPTAGQADSNLHYLLRWADSFRATRLPNGEVVRGSGRAVVYADLVSAVLNNMPLALGLALALTLLMVLLAFRRLRDAGPVMLALVAGLLWLALGMQLLDVRIHFVNFVALPITLGVGVDYALNVMSRYRDAGGGPDGVRAALRGTGGPIILCSLTTTLGYVALLGSRNQAVRSLGLIAVLGEVSCLMAAMLVLPAALSWASRRQRAQRSFMVGGRTTGG